MSPRTRISLPRSLAIAELAEFVADEYFPSGRVDAEVILQQKSVTTSFGSYGDYFDGMLECLNGEFHVYCNTRRVEGRTSPRARFTLAHELGHFFIDEHRQALLQGSPPHGSRCEYESDILVEQEADTFASNLLLPRTRFLNTAKTRGLPHGLSGILNLASTFGTSITATAIRYAQEDLVPCTVIKWNDKGFAWKWFSPETYRAGYRKTIETKDEVPLDSPTGRVLAGETPSEGDFLRAGSTAAFWFPFVADHGKNNVILIEEAISLGRFGVLTFIYPESGSYSQSRF